MIRGLDEIGIKGRELWGSIAAGTIAARIGRGRPTGRRKDVRRSAIWGFRLLLLCLLALGQLLGSSTAALAIPTDPIERVPPINPPPFRVPADGFRWSVPSHFGERDANGMIDYHWDPQTGKYRDDYVHPTSYPVYFFGCQTQSDEENGPSANTYVWQEVDGAGNVLGNLRQGQPNACGFAYTGWPNQSEHKVRLTVTNGTNTDGTPKVAFGPFTQTVTVKDYLIVSIGDSYASGEGNPDIPQHVYSIIQLLWDTFWGVDPKAVWENERCHRSEYAGPAQAALALELESSKSSVTFVSLACSGATINTPTYDGDRNKPLGTGILGGYRGAAPAEGVGYSEAERLPAQLDALHDLVGDRQIDALIVSGGGNDIGFGNIASTCVLFGACYNINVDDDFFFDWNGRPLGNVVADKIAALPGKYAEMADAIYNPTSTRRLNVANVFVTEYPDMTKKDDGSYCSGILNDILPSPFAMTAAESAWAIDHVLGPLNAALQKAVSDQVEAGRQWHYVGNIREAFGAHGYCASDNWIRTASESMEMQGPFPGVTGPSLEGTAALVLARGATKGTLHPTVDGHQVYKARILAGLHSALLPSTTPPPSAPSFSAANSIGGTTSRAGSGGWLTGSCTGTTCSSDNVVLTITAQDSAAIRGASLEVNGSLISTVNGVPQCPTGMACTGGLSSDGKTYQWTFTITQDGIYRLQLAARGDDDQATTFTREVRVDLHDPTATLLPASEATSDGWYPGPLELTLAGQDASGGAGFDRAEYSIDGGPTDSVSSGQKITLGDGDHTVTFRPIDLAGRQGAVQTFTAKVDATAPTIQCGSADGDWHDADVSIDCTASDGGSGLKNATGDAGFSLSTSVAAGEETADAATPSREVCDNVGNCATADPITGNKVDKKAPVVSCGTADADWHADDVTISCTASDGGVGLADSTDASFTLKTSVPVGTETANAATGSHEVKDTLEHKSTAGPISGNKVDRKAPSITLTAPASGPYMLGQVVNASYSCSDGGSGVGACDGNVANGAAIDTSTVGSKTFTVNATDKAGNKATASVSYTVQYRFDGFLQPINDAAHYVGTPPPMSVFKAGSTVPVKFQLKDAAGNPVQAATLPTFSATPAGSTSAAVDETVYTDTPTAGTAFKWDPTSQQYVYNWSTKSQPPGSKWQICATADDNQPLCVTIGLK